MKVLRSFLAALLLVGSLVVSATAAYAEDETQSWQERVREMRKFKYEYAQD
jgi:hypothetical protein